MSSNDENSFSSDDYSFDEEKAFEELSVEAWSRINLYSCGCTHSGCTVDGAHIDDGSLYAVSVGWLDSDGGPIWPRKWATQYVCRTRAIALQYAMKELFSDSGGWFYEEMYWEYIKNQEHATQIAARIGKTQELDEIYMAMYHMVQCEDCSEMDDRHRGSDRYVTRNRVYVCKHKETEIKEDYSSDD